MHMKIKKLQKNLEQYLSQEPIQEVIDLFVPKQSKLQKLIRPKQSWDLRVYGGCIRDTYLEQTPKDVDICVDIPLNFLSKILNNFCFDSNWLYRGGINGFTSTKFGGYRFEYKGISFDIWTMQDMWLYREKADKYTSLDDLHLSAQCSCNMITYDPVQKSFQLIPDYFELLDQKIVNINHDNIAKGHDPNYRKNYLLYRIGAKSSRECVMKQEFNYNNQEATGFTFFNKQNVNHVSFLYDGRIQMAWPRP